MKTYTVDFTGVEDYWDFYEALKKGFGFPEWAGKNADAVWDLLTGYIEEPATVYLKGLSSIPKKLEREKNLFCRVLVRASHYYAGRTSYVIKVVD